ncbi:MAG: hypothetical protein AB4911_06235 [Oscillochloridaceae bacterium umkhey_bin13]
MSVAVPFVPLIPLGEDRYRANFDRFNEPGTYRIVIQAFDNDGFNALPVVATSGQNRVYLPLLAR